MIHPKHKKQIDKWIDSGLKEDVLELETLSPTEIEETKKPKRPATNMYSHGSHGGIDDEYYIDELIGLDDFTYSDWIGDKRLGEQQREEIARKYFYKERADKEKK